MVINDSKFLWIACQKNVILLVCDIIHNTHIEIFTSGFYFAGREYTCEWIYSYNKNQFHDFCTNLDIHLNLSYGEILSGQPGAWLVKNIFLFAWNYKIKENEVILEYKTISRIYLWMNYS